MFTAFQNFMDKYFMPVAEKVDNNPHLKAVKSGMMGLTPFTILGSIFAILPALPNMIGKGNFLSQFIISNAELLDMPVTLSLGFLSLYAVMTISYALGHYYKLYIPGSIGLSTFAFVMLTIRFDKNGVPDIANFGAKGLFVAIFVGLLTVELYRWCQNHHLSISMPEGVPDFVSSSFEMIPTALIVGGAFIIIRGLSLAYVGVLPPEMISIVVGPLVGSMDSLTGVWLLGILQLTLFFFGIHPSVLSGITAPIMYQFFAENVEALRAGQAIPHFYAPGSISAYFGFTGAGISIGVVILAMFSKSNQYKKIGKLSFIPCLFGINEPILFGLPVILNPIMMILFILGGNIVGQLPYMFMEFGWLSKPIFTPPYVGAFFEGFLTAGDWRSILVNALQVVLAVLIYLPFFKVMEKAQLKEENEIKEAKVLDDESLLDDLDLDF
ncbi:PTS sugar transporter subunit IIC [Latilactobacillus fuchuensis]|uniref:Permease IIC component n=1 Tax=Latilactobacillus fuchuensis TaxID=164393 RepID=A0A2N9DXC3_9LACO|nr:PTS transporter subunit EIIC [Latilactobacillus fuchuensis]SPC39321.1 PTS system, lactose/cellobiose family IIC component [Latilactobacillus fuchuensis]